MGMWRVPLQGGNSAAVASQQFYDIDRLIRLFSSSVRLTVVPWLFTCITNPFLRVLTLKVFVLQSISTIGC